MPSLTTGEVIAERIRRNDSAAFTGFPAMLHQMIPRCLRIHLIMDNGPNPRPLPRKRAHTPR